MPGRNGTGPMGQGSLTGRGLGNCNGVNATRTGIGRGLGLGRGFRRNFAVAQTTVKTEKDLLMEQKNLKNRLDGISKQLENLSKDDK